MVILIFVGSSVIGSIILGKLVDKTKKYKLIYMTGLICTLGTVVAELIIFSTIEGNTFLLYIVKVV